MILANNPRFKIQAITLKGFPFKTEEELITAKGFGQDDWYGPDYVQVNYSEDYNEGSGDVPYYLTLADYDTTGDGVNRYDIWDLTQMGDSDPSPHNDEPFMFEQVVEWFNGEFMDINDKLKNK